MPVDLSRLCDCHGEAMTMLRDGYLRCTVKRKAAGRRANETYVRTLNGKARHLKYRRTAKGKASARRSDRKRIFIGNTYHSRADTVERAAAINAHIRRRLIELKQRQPTGAETEGVPPRAVRPETKA